jgi:hypothetical protein
LKQNIDRSEIMSTSNNDQKSQKSQHVRSANVQKSGKGSRRHIDDDENTTPVNRGKPEQHDPGNNPQTFSSKVSESGPSDKMGRSRKSDRVEDDEED